MIWLLLRSVARRSLWWARVSTFGAHAIGPSPRAGWEAGVEIGVDGDSALTGNNPRASCSRESRMAGTGVVASRLNGLVASRLNGLWS